MSRRSLGLVIGLAIGAAAAIYVIAGRGRSGTSGATASSSPSDSQTEPRSMDSPRPGPSLDPRDIGAETARSGDGPTSPRPQVPPELQARVAALAGSRAPAPAGTATVRPNRAAYDATELQARRAQAVELLAKQPDDVDAKRIVVSTSCALDDVKTARKINASLPPGDRADMARACRELGVRLSEDPRWDMRQPTGIPAPTKQRPPT
jgi:hypothetical protein